MDFRLLGTTRADFAICLQGSRTFTLKSGGELAAMQELGLRKDGGEAKQGAGLDLGGEVHHFHPDLGLTVEAFARQLLVHASPRDREWVIGSSVRLDPGSAGRGLSLSLGNSSGTSPYGANRPLFP